MAYTTVIAALAAAKRATAGNTIFAEWGAAAQTDIEYLALNAILKDGTTNMAATLNTFSILPITNNTYGVGNGTYNWASMYTYLLGIAGTTVINSSREAINLAGISADTTARKLMVDINAHKYYQNWTTGTFTLTNGDSAPTFNYPATQPGTVTAGNIRTQCMLDFSLASATPSSGALGVPYVQAITATSVTISLYSSFGSSITGVNLDILTSTSQ